MCFPSSKNLPSLAQTHTLRRPCHPAIANSCNVYWQMIVYALEGVIPLDSQVLVSDVTNVECWFSMLIQLASCAGNTPKDALVEKAFGECNTGSPASAWTYIEVFRKYKPSLSACQIDRLLQKLDAASSPAENSSKTLLFYRAKALTAYHTKLNKSKAKNKTQIDALKSSPPTMSTKPQKPPRTRKPVKRTKPPTPQKAPESPDKHRHKRADNVTSPLKKYQQQKTKSDLSRLRMEVGDLQSKFNAVMKKGTAKQQEAQQQTNRKLTAVLLLAHGKWPYAHTRGGSNTNPTQHTGHVGWEVAFFLFVHTV